MRCPLCDKPMRKGTATIERSVGGRLLGDGNHGLLRFTPERGDAVDLLGAAARRDASFCEDCGTLMIRGELADDHVVRCPACGETNPPDFESCWKCRAPL